MGSAQAARYAEGVPVRFVTPIFDAAIRLRIRNSTCRAALTEHGGAVTEATTSRDLRALVDADLLVVRGERRGRHYPRNGRLRQIYEHLVSQRDVLTIRDPFAAADVEA